MLAERYGFGPDVVAAMTPAQQLMYIDNDTSGERYVMCATMAEATAELQRIRAQRT